MNLRQGHKNLYQLDCIAQNSIEETLYCPELAVLIRSAALSFNLSSMRMLSILDVFSAKKITLHFWECHA